MAYVVEDFGKYNKIMEADLNLLVPFIDRIAYRCTLNLKSSVDRYSNKSSHEKKTHIFLYDTHL